MVGTAAVVLGHLLHVPALSTLHWSGGDAWLGLQLAAPIILLGEASLRQCRLSGWVSLRQCHPFR